MSYQENFQIRLNERIAELNITQEQIIEKCKKLNVNISKGQISKIINGIHSPSIDKAYAISKVLGFKYLDDMLKD